MPAKSKAQQKAAGAALAAKRGETPVNQLKGASKSMYESMSEKQLDEFASTKRKANPSTCRKRHSNAYFSPIDLRSDYFASINQSRHRLRDTHGKPTPARAVVVGQFECGRADKPAL
jgi:Protein of unknwon function (DUF3008)